MVCGPFGRVFAMNVEGQRKGALERRDERGECPVNKLTPDRCYRSVVSSKRVNRNK